MIEKIFTEDEIKLLADLKLEGINNLNIEDVISSFLRVNGFDKNYNVTKDGKLAESILDKISEF